MVRYEESGGKEENCDRFHAGNNRTSEIEVDRANSGNIWCTTLPRLLLSSPPWNGSVKFRGCMTGDSGTIKVRSWFNASRPGDLVGSQARSLSSASMPISMSLPLAPSNSELQGAQHMDGKEKGRKAGAHLPIASVRPGAWIKAKSKGEVLEMS